MKTIFNWSQLSRVLNLDRTTLRSGKIAHKHLGRLDKLFFTDIPRWWAEERMKYEKD